MKFCSILVKACYYSAIFGMDKNANKNIENILFKNYNIFQDQNTLFMHIFLLVLIFIVSLISLQCLILPLILSALIKRARGRSKNYPAQINFVISFNIYFIINNPKDVNINQ